ncbi:hypothetical protein PIB30_044449 [Stylosanthes scabra]|uniref:Secreted protein n=1 Tax=Stylosanthes scabra TaxID=79078 RepID=A0ABU6SFW8_9FABA|nr:hypothetical protein [Stylosanthes scabra]
MSAASSFALVAVSVQRSFSTHSCTVLFLFVCFDNKLGSVSHVPLCFAVSSCDNNSDHSDPTLIYPTVVNVKCASSAFFLVYPLVGSLPFTPVSLGRLRGSLLTALAKLFLMWSFVLWKEEILLLYRCKSIQAYRYGVVAVGWPTRVPAYTSRA